MKLIVAVCLLLASATGQNAPAPVATESLAPSLSVTFVSQRDGSYQFSIVNKSSHAVTALALRLVPSGVPKVNDNYACDSRCGGSMTIGDNSKPVIAASGSIDLSFQPSSVAGGAVVAEAAVFDDESYEGDVPTAAIMVAGQIGNQAEYDRIVTAVEGVLAGNATEEQKILRMRVQLGELPVTLETAMITTLKRWFPGLPDCNHQDANTMKNASAREKQTVVSSIEQFSHSAARTRGSLEQWWDKTKQQLVFYGCSGCTAQAMYPKPHTTPIPAAALACATNTAPGPVRTVSASHGRFTITDDESDMDADDSDSEVGLSTEDSAAVAADDVVSQPLQPAPPAPVAAANPAPSVSAPSNATIHTAPSGPPVPLPGPSITVDMRPSARAFRLGLLRLAAPVPDYLLYRIFFSEIASLDDTALHEWPGRNDDRDKSDDDLPSAGLTDAEIDILKQASIDCNRQLTDLWTKTGPLIRANTLRYGALLVVYGPPPQALRDYREKRQAVVEKQMEQLRAKLGKTSFTKLDSFVRRIHRPLPPPVNTLPLTEDAVFPGLTGFTRNIYIPHSLQVYPLSRLDDDTIYAHFFRYVTALDELTAKHPEGEQPEIAKRQDDLRAHGLEEKEWTLVKQVAEDYNKEFLRLVKVNGPVIGIGVPSGVLSARPSIAGLPVSAGAVPPATVGTGIGASPQPQTASEVRGVPAGQDVGHFVPKSPAELEKAHAEDQLNLITHIGQLQAGLGNTKFQTLSAYLRELYAQTSKPAVVTTTAEKTTKPEKDK